MITQNKQAPYFHNGALENEGGAGGWWSKMGLVKAIKTVRKHIVSKNNIEQ